MQQNPYIQQNPYGNQPAGLPGSPIAQSGALSKPGFGNLTTGRPPIDEVIGIIQDWKVEFDPQYQSSNFHLLMQNIQVLHSQSPWPYTECDIRIRVGTGLNGGWGLFGQSIAAQLGCYVGCGRCRPVEGPVGTSGLYPQLVLRCQQPEWSADDW